MNRLLFLLCFPVLLSAQREGTLLEHETLPSTVLGKSVNYAVYLPPDYNRSQRSYPVVYLLHGYTDNHTGWTQFGEIPYLLDDAIRERRITPMIVVMPDADVSWYLNNHDGSVRYEDFFVQELLPVVERTYRIRADRRYRALAGLSMGGYGALLYALNHPDLFATTAPLSAAVYTEAQVLAQPQARWDRIEGVLYGEGRTGDARLTDHWRQNNIFQIIAGKTTEELRRLRYWIDCGDDDFLTEANAQLHIALREKDVPHEFRMRDGGHTWTYWRTGIVPALEFISAGFHQQ